MIDKLKGEPKEIYAVLLLFALALSIWHFVPKSTLPDYVAAVQVRDALSGTAGAQLECIAGSECIAKPVAIHISIAAELEKLYSSFQGASPSDPASIVAFLLIFPSVLLAASSAILYLALREFGMKKSLSAFGALLFCLSASSLAFLPGAYSGATLAALALSLFLFCLGAHAKKGGVAMLALAALFAAAAGYVDASFGAAAALAALCLAAAKKTEGKSDGLSQLAFLAIVALAAAALSLQKPDVTLGSVRGAFALLPFMIAAASTSAILYVMKAGKLEQALLFLSGIIASVLSPPAGAMLLALPAADGFSRLAGEAPKNALLACSFSAIFLAILGLGMPFPSIWQAILIAAIAGAFAPLVLHLYDYSSKGYFAALGVLLVALCISSAIFMQAAISGYYPRYTHPDTASALGYLSSKGAASIATLERQDAVGFYLPGAKAYDAEDALSYLAEGSPLPAAGTHVLSCLQSIDSGSGNLSFESYWFAGNTTFQDGRVAVLFASASGRRAAREIGPDGKFALRDGLSYDFNGYYYGPIPLSRMMMLSETKPFYDAGNRLILVEEGSLPPHFVSMYSGSDPHALLEKEFGGCAAFVVD